MQAPINRALPAGYQLLDYRIDSVLSSGGFSFVYLAHDSKKQLVAIKEYLPSTLALRTEGDRVEPRSHDNLGGFNHGLKCFFEEGKALAKISHDNVVHVTNFFRANNTVYLVMEYEEGESLQDYIRAHPNPAGERFVRRLFGEMLNGLREVHTHKLLHLDIKPANIHIRKNGSPLLLDFGSARRTLTEVESQLFPSFTPGFAPPEQYTNRQALGPWSDIYSVGATMYACLIRSSPLAADQRSKEDTLVPASKLGKKIYSNHLLNIIDWCMKIDPLARPQSVFTLQKALLEQVPAKPGKLSVFGALRKKIIDMSTT